MSRIITSTGVPSTLTAPTVPPTQPAQLPPSLQQATAAQVTGPILSNLAPLQIGLTNLRGISGAAAREDHVHAHGVQEDPTLHSLATTSAHGFMLASDKEKLNYLVSVTDFGAVGDGHTNDTSAILAAFAAVAPGGEVFFPQGIYLVDANSTVVFDLTTPRVRIRGLGRGAIIKCVRPFYHLFRLLTDELHFENITVWGATVTTAPVSPLTIGCFAFFTDAQLYAPQGVTFSRVKISGPNSTTGFNNGIKADTGCDSWTIERCLLERLIGSDANTGAGYGILMGAATNFEIMHNRFLGNQGTSPVQGRHAVYTSGGSSHNKIHDNVVVNYNSTGFPIFSYNHSPACQYNEVYRNKVVGKAVGETDTADFTCEGNVQYNTIADNVSIDSGAAAIILSDVGQGGLCDSNEVSGNRIIRAGTFGILLRGAMRTRMSRTNVVEDNSQSSHNSFASVYVTSQGTGNVWAQAADNEVNVAYQIGQSRVFFIGDATATSPIQLTLWGQPLAISTITNSGGLFSVQMPIPHGFSTGMKVAIHGVLGCPTANGYWTITVINATTFTLQGSTFAGSYTNGTGTAQGPKAHGLVTGDMLRPSDQYGILTGTANIAAEWLITVVDAFTISLNTSTGAGNIQIGAVTAGTAASPSVLTIGTHGLPTGSKTRVVVSGVQGLQGVNGVWTATVVSATQISLDNSTGTGAWTSGGIVRSLGDAISVTHRAILDNNNTGPVPRDTRPIYIGGHLGSGAPGGTPIAVLLNGIPLGATDVLYVWDRSRGKPVQMADRGDLRGGDQMSLGAFTQALNSGVGSGSKWIGIATDGTIDIGDPNVSLRRDGIDTHINLGYSSRFRLVVPGQISHVMSVTMPSSGTNPTNAIWSFFGVAGSAQKAPYVLTYNVKTRTLSTSQISTYTGIDNTQVGSVYAKLSDLEALRGDLINIAQVLAQLAQDNKDFGWSG